MLTWCNDDFVEGILRKISVSYLRRSTQADENIEGLGLVEQDIEKGQYFFRLHYDFNTEQYTEIPKGRLNPPRVKGRAAPECGSCAQKQEFAASGRDGEVRLFGRLEPGSQYSLSVPGL